MILILWLESANYQKLVAKQQFFTLILNLDNNMHLFKIVATNYNKLAGERVNTFIL